MEAFLDMPDIALPGDLTPNDFTPSDEISSTTPFEKETSTKSPKMGPPTTPSTKKPPTTPSAAGPPNTTPKKRPPTTPFKEESIMKLLDQKQFKTTNPPIYRTAKPFDRLPPTKPLYDWKHENFANETDWFPNYKYKFVFVTATQPPLTRAVHAGAIVVKVVFGAAVLLLALMALSNYMNRKHRTRRVSGLVLADNANDVEQNLQIDERTCSEPAEPEPLNNDSPPSYHECSVYSMNEGVGEGPPPYTNTEYHKQRQDGLVENERRACSEDVPPEMGSEQVFHSGRIIDRLSLDANRNNKTRDTSNDNVVK